ncbi:MAG: hypothetical protein LW809_00590 [Vampirovibrionales bacterium]|jgi:hypothetical protein|nr:hypothetical protein [Vampirovibrionales bacterium]
MMIGSITSSLILPQQVATFNPRLAQENAQQDAQLKLWLKQKGLTDAQIGSLNSQQRANYLQQMQMSQGGNFSNLGATATGINGLVNASNGNPLAGAQALGIGSLGNANAASMGAVTFGKVNAQAATIISQMMQAGAAIDPAGTAALAQKINGNPTWQMTTNPMYQQTLAQIQPYLQIGAQQNAYIALQQQQQLQAQAAQEKAKKAEKDDA